MAARTEEAGPQGLASALVQSGALHSDWLPTYKAVLRDRFVPDRIWPGIPDGTRQNPLVDRTTAPDAWLRAVFSDIPLTTQWDDGNHAGDGLGTTPSSSSSQPHMVFSMLADLDVRDGHRVLEIGTGTGWNAGLLSHRLGSGNVVSIEFDPEVAKGAGENLRGALLSPLVIVGDGRLGYAGGRLTVNDDGTASGHFTRSSAFMRLRQQRQNQPPHNEYLKDQEWPADGDRSTTTLSPAEVGGWLEQFVIGLCMPGAFWTVERYADGAYTLWTYSTDTKSWASADYEPERQEYDVVQCGLRRLWDETEAAYRWWVQQGRPGFDRFGLTADSNGGRTWLDSPNNLVTVHHSA
ncbi:MULTISPECIES: protein-L-isoaspartate(D-aspartate) O-methyltransferase [unclassified Streptomyces]|uniref:protein-L-isoaspartate(D-aspartate) O-methyltransferase n=1 Tax=unclassified Streptomyces TaxID=2593676 RepID=UPI002E3631B2|nr:protein-L-isoaspartate(D-aspartate) O-methyltransferase [Streptomyces sp. NBC_01278]